MTMTTTTASSMLNVQCTSYNQHLCEGKRCPMIRSIFWVDRDHIREREREHRNRKPIAGCGGCRLPMHIAQQTLYSRYDGIGTMPDHCTMVHLTKQLSFLASPFCFPFYRLFGWRGLVRNIPGFSQRANTHSPSLAHSLTNPKQTERRSSITICRQ